MPHSANVTVYLLVGEIKLSVSHLSNDFMIIRKNETALIAGQATLVVQVDESTDHQDVVIQNDIQRGKPMKRDNPVWGLFYMLVNKDP